MTSKYASISPELITSLAQEIASGIDVAVESWMAEIENALQTDHLTTLGRVGAVREVLARYKTLTGKNQLHQRRVLDFEARLYGR